MGMRTHLGESFAFFARLQQIGLCQSTSNIRSFVTVVEKQKIVLLGKK